MIPPGHGTLRHHESHRRSQSAAASGATRCSPCAFSTAHGESKHDSVPHDPLGWSSGKIADRAKWVTIAPGIVQDKAQRKLGGATPLLTHRRIAASCNKRSRDLRTMPRSEGACENMRSGETRRQCRKGADKAESINFSGPAFVIFGNSKRLRPALRTVEIVHEP